MIAGQGRTRRGWAIRSAAVTAAAALAATVGITASVGNLAANADPIGAAQARAQAISARINALNNRAEAVSQRYDAIEAKLGAAVTSGLTAARDAATATTAIRQEQQDIANQVVALYESAGSFNLMTSFINGSSTSEALTRTQISSNVLSSTTVAVSRDRMIVQRSQQQANVHLLSAKQQAKLQLAAGKLESKVNSLLSQARTELRSADAQVKSLMAADQQAANSTEIAAFAAAMRGAGGSLDTNTAAPNPIVAAAIAAAKSRLGVPYVWGATGPDAFDCSGLTQWSYAHAGIALPRTAAEQWFSGPHPALTQLEPGDLLFWSFGSDPATIHHVTIYLGDGMMIAAPHTGENVQIQPVYLDGFFGATRPWASSI